MRLHLFKPLQPRICNLAYLLRLEVFPPAPIKRTIKRVNLHHRHHIDERIAHIAAVVEVYRQVQEVIGADGDPLVNSLLQQELSVLVGDILDHEGCPVVTEDLMWGDLEMLDLLGCMGAGLNSTKYS
jgi:hypothetical protein